MMQNSPDSEHYQSPKASGEAGKADPRAAASISRPAPYPGARPRDHRPVRSRAYLARCATECRLGTCGHSAHLHAIAPSSSRDSQGTRSPRTARRHERGKPRDLEGRPPFIRRRRFGASTPNSTSTHQARRLHHEVRLNNKAANIQVHCSAADRHAANTPPAITHDTAFGRKRRWRLGGGLSDRMLVGAVAAENVAPQNSQTMRTDGERRARASTPQNCDEEGGCAGHRPARSRRSAACPRRAPAHTSRAARWRMRCSAPASRRRSIRWRK